MQIGEGERIAGKGALGVTLLADLEQVGIASVRSEPVDRSAAPLHLHERHAECFVVLDGELRIRLEDRELHATAETCVLIPPGVLHSVTATGDAPAHFLDIHAPSCGFGDFVRALNAARNEDELREARAAFDQLPPPEYASSDPGLVVVRRSGGTEGEALSDRPERRLTALLDADEIVLTEFSYEPGERGAPLHVHSDHADGFLVLDGEVAFSFRDGSQDLPSGSLAIFPPGVAHGFDIDGDATARCFNFHVPAAGYVEYMRGRNPGFDQHDPPPDGGLDPAAAVIVRLPE